MSTEQQPVDPNAVEETKQQIRGLVNEIAQLSRQEIDPAVFYGEFLGRIISALAAVGGAVWIRGESSTGLELKYQINLKECFPEDDSGESHARHARLLHRVVRDGELLGRAADEARRDRARARDGLLPGSAPHVKPGVLLAYLLVPAASPACRA